MRPHSKPFELKNLIIEHHRSPFKIGTDALLLGASCRPDPGDHIIDLGAGCGIIGLMIASRFPSIHLTSLEEDEFACQECRINFRVNHISSRAHCIQAEIVEWASVTNLRFDFVVCNPPYFHNDLLPTNNRLSKAKHANSLTLDNLTRSASCLLTDKGRFAVIIPYFHYPILVENCRRLGLFLLEVIFIKSLSGKKAIRCIAIFNKEDSQSPPLQKTLVIQQSNARNDWTKEYKDLLQDFKNFD